MTSTDQWINRTYLAEDVGPVLELLQASMGPGSHGARQRVWEWKHLNNPFGASFVRLASFDGEQVVGLRALMQWQFRMGGRTLRAVRAVDTATHTDFRRLGIFSTLTKSVIEDVKQDGVDVIFNTPNRYSMPGYLKMGWGVTGIAKPLVRVLNPPRFAIGLARHSTKLRHNGEYPEDKFFKQAGTKVADLLGSAQDQDAVNELLKRSEAITTAVDSVSTDRSLEFLCWRYAEHPYITYYAATVGNGKALDAMAIFRTNTRFGLREVVMTELFMAEPNEKLAKEIIREVEKRVQADYVVGYFKEGSFLRQMLKRCGFHTVPKGGMAVTSRVLDKELPFDPFTLGSWEFSMGDLELF